MVKKPRAGTGKVEQSAEKTEVIVGDTKQKKSTRRLAAVRKRFVPIVVVAVVIAAGIFYFIHHHNSNEAAVTQIPMGQAYINQQLANMKDNEPSDKAPLSQRLNYYDTLMTTEAGTADYKGATATYQKRISISTSGMSALNYFRAAQWYAQLKDKAGALKALDASQKALASGGSEAYSQAQFQTSIDDLRQEVSQ